VFPPPLARGFIWNNAEDIMELVEYTIRTGSFAEIKRGLLQGTLNLLYSGMPNDSTFVLTPIVNEAVLLQGFKFATPIFYRKDCNAINVLGDEFRVLDVNPDKIRLHFVKIWWKLPDIERMASGRTGPPIVWGLLHDDYPRL
jgi:hypothetical protein